MKLASFFFRSPIDFLRQIAECVLFSILAVVLFLFLFLAGYFVKLPVVIVFLLALFMSSLVIVLGVKRVKKQQGYALISLVEGTWEWVDRKWLQEKIIWAKSLSGDLKSKKRDLQKSRKELENKIIYYKRKRDEVVSRFDVVEEEIPPHMNARIQDLKDGWGNLIGSAEEGIAYSRGIELELDDLLMRNKQCLEYLEKEEWIIRQGLKSEKDLDSVSEVYNLIEDLRKKHKQLLEDFRALEGMHLSFLQSYDQIKITH